MTFSGLVASAELVETEGSRTDGCGLASTQRRGGVVCVLYEEIRIESEMEHEGGRRASCGSGNGTPGLDAGLRRWVREGDGIRAVDAQGGREAKRIWEGRQKWRWVMDVETGLRTWNWPG